MPEPHPAQAAFEDLLTRLELTVAGPDKAYGEVQGSPVVLTVLGMDPPALLLGFKIQSPHPPQIECPADLAALVEKKVAECSLEKGIAWLSLDDLTGRNIEQIEELITGFAKALGEANVRLPEGCADCQSKEDVTVLYSDDRCSRLCGGCRERIVAEVMQREAELNRPSSWFAIGLPLIFLYVSVGWMLLWWFVDQLFIWTNSDQVSIGLYEGVAVLAVLWAIAGAMGYPIGVFLRRSGVPASSHWLPSAVVVILACVAGEWLYVTTVVHREVKLLDPVLAGRLLLPMAQGYHPTWMAGKVLVAGAIILGCHYAAKARRTASVRL